MKQAKNICRYCHIKMRKDIEDCIKCGGYEYYQCPKCNRIFDVETGEEI